MAVELEQEAFLASRTDSAGKTIAETDLVGLVSSLQCVDLFLDFDCLPWCSLGHPLPRICLTLAFKRLYPDLSLLVAIIGGIATIGFGSK